MALSVLSRVGGALRWSWRLLDQTRRALVNLLLVAIVVAVAWLGWRSLPRPLEPRTALVLGLAGPLVEQQTGGGGTRELALGQLRDRPRAQTRLRDLVAVLDAAAKDEAVPHALLLLDDFAGAGLPALREAAAAVERFKAADKKVYAWGSGYDQRQYYLAAHASEVWLDPMGAVEIEGYGRHRNYYKDALDRIGVRVNVVRAGRYKNAAESLAASAPSPETLESDSALYGSLWASYTQGVERARKLEPGSVARLIDDLPRALPAAGGDLARLALDARLVDALKTRNEVRTLLIERGERDEAHKTFRQVGWGAYLGRIKPDTVGDAVGVIVAQGSITDGAAPPGRVGGLSTAELVRKAREDDRIKAIVLRINSPGGSAYGSELVRRELALARQAGKPVVVSMGDLAASGGYWIALAADEILADEATITGSIGVVSMLPTAKGALDKLGVHTGGVTTTWLGAGYDPRLEPDPRFLALVQAAVGRVYADFLERAAAQRKTDTERIDAVGQGRVWSGRQALEHKLVDRLGGFGDAVRAAAARAQLGEAPRLVWLEAEPGRLERWLRRFGLALGDVIEEGLGALAVGPAAPLFGAPAAAAAWSAPLAREAVHDLAWLLETAERRRPFDALAHCLCVAP